MRSTLRSPVIVGLLVLSPLAAQQIPFCANLQGPLKTLCEAANRKNQRPASATPQPAANNPPSAPPMTAAVVSQQTGTCQRKTADSSPLSTTAPSPAPPYELTGEWEGNYGNIIERVKIQQTGATILAIKIPMPNSPSDYPGVRAGEVSFCGNYKADKFVGAIQVANPSTNARDWYPTTVALQDADLIRVGDAQSFHRIGARSAVLGKTESLTVYLGGAGGDAQYIPDQVAALREVGVKNVVAGIFKGNIANNLTLIPWLRDRRKVDFMNVEIAWTLDQELSLKDTGQTPINFIGYSYGSLIAAQCAAYYADSGREIRTLVLIGSPISSGFLDDLRSNKNITNVIVVDLTPYGDQVYAGMPAFDVVNPLTFEGIGAQFIAYQEAGLGHFYYAPNNDLGRKRRRELATFLWNDNLR